MNKIEVKALAENLTGISCPLPGQSWNPPQDEQDMAKRMLIFLKGRRALYSSGMVEKEEYIIQSVYRIRKHLAEDFSLAGKESVLGQSIEAMRSACRKFCKEVKRPRKRQAFTPSFLFCLSELRSLFGSHIVRIACAYGLDIDKDLKDLMPQGMV